MSTADLRINDRSSIELATLQPKEEPRIGLPNSAQDEQPVIEQQYPHGIRLVFITIGLILSIFIAALDSTIIATAIPRITTQLGGISNIAWYGSALAITNAAFQSPWGKSYQCFPLKITFLLAIAVFETGNVICATAPTSEMLIFGRVIAGMGQGGVMTGAFIMIALTASPHYRAAYMGVGGVSFAFASVIGPLLGGALTDGPGWRWCFWISIPIGFTAAAIMCICFKNQPKPKEASVYEKIQNLDLNGAIILSGSFSCFVLAMHWIGIHPFTSSRVLGSFGGFLFLLICFIANEWAMGDKAMVQAFLFKKKLVHANLWYAFFMGGAFFPLQFTLPIQFQSVNNSSASQSGVRLIPLVMGCSIFTLISNGLLTFWRHYKPFLFVGALLTLAGNAKIYTLGASTSSRDWIIYELLTATGVGLALQIPMIANQALVSADEVAAATSMSLFFENCGTVLFIASSEAAFTSGLLSGLARSHSKVDAQQVLDAGATQIRNLFHGRELDQVLGGYLNGCKTSHVVAVACGAMAGLVSLSNAGPAAIQWLRLKQKKPHDR